MSLVFLIHSSRTSLSRHNLANRDVVVMHMSSPQHLFSTACGIGLHMPQTHQGTEGVIEDGPGSDAAEVEPVISAVSMGDVVLLGDPNSLSSRSSSMINRVWMKSMLPIPLRNPLMANFLTIASSSV